MVRVLLLFNYHAYIFNLKSTGHVEVMHIMHSFNILLYFHSVGCSKIGDSYSNNMLLNALTFSQAPGTEILILCSSSDHDREEIFYSNCQDNGRWELDLNSGLCSKGNKVITANY